MSLTQVYTDQLDQTHPKNEEVSDDTLFLIGVGDEGGAEALGLLPKAKAYEFLNKASCPWFPFAHKATEWDLEHHKMLDTEKLPYC
jgi:hypothetical protein